MATFLIVDADRNFSHALAIALRLDGHVAVPTATAEDGHEQLGSSTPYDCCVVDAHLAGADDLLEAATKSGLRTVVTGPYADLLAAAATRHPRADVLPKPFRASELTARLGPAGAARA